MSTLPAFPFAEFVEQPWLTVREIHYPRPRRKRQVKKWEKNARGIYYGVLPDPSVYYMAGGVMGGRPMIVAHPVTLARVRQQLESVRVPRMTSMISSLAIR